MDFACLKGGQIVVIDLNMQAKDLKTWKMREIENVEYQELDNSNLGNHKVSSKLAPQLTKMIPWCPYAQT